MAPLVPYPDSDDDGDDDDGEPTAPPPPAKPCANTLPPLPASFRDQYSATARTSTRDDPAMHAGRTRITPHVVGNWPTHVYLEWLPTPEERLFLDTLLDHVRQSRGPTSPRDEAAIFAKDHIHSLLQTDLGVHLPLHISLSRPLLLKTDQKDSFCTRLSTELAATRAHAFSVKSLDLYWHPNEDRTRWFLVLRLQRPPGDELRTLLDACNRLAARAGQPLLYHASPAEDPPSEPGTAGSHDSFHISIAWSLPPHALGAHEMTKIAEQVVGSALRAELACVHLHFAEVKLRVGQDVSSIPLQKSRISASHD